ncbi:MAG: hypothetical protein WCK09_08760 [Bacteroidota bacterium]
MIDKQQLNDFFQYFEKELVIELIDLANKNIPEIITAIAKDIDDLDFVDLKRNACQIRGICSSFNDPISSNIARDIEDAAGNKLIEITRITLSEFPEIRAKKEPSHSAHGHWLEVMSAGSPKNYLISLIGPFADEDSLKLAALEKRIMAEGIPEMFSELKVAATLLLEEMQIIKQELMAG